MRPAALALALSLIAPAPAPADDAPASRPLFDGKTLEGWKVSDYFRPGPVKVEDGALVIGRGRPMSGVTCTLADLPKVDYELTYEARRLEGGDFFAAATFPVGDSHLTLVNGGWGGGVTGLSSLNGADASENETGRSVKYATGTWYRFRVRVTAEVIRAAVDDKELIVAAVDGRQVGVRVESNPSKPLGFSTYDTAGAVRNVRVRPLTPAEVAEVRKVPEEG